MFLRLIVFCLLPLVWRVEGGRERRYLVYPNGGPARAQFIIGLGIPVDLKEQSVTVGTVIKFQYDLPTNSSEYTTRIYGFANTVASRNMDTERVENHESEKNELDIDNKSSTERKSYDNDTLEEETEEGNETLVDLTFEESRKKRALAYAEGGTINTIVEAELPLEEAIRRQELVDKQYEDKQAAQRMNRWDFYKVIQHMAERYGYSGRPCLLRTVCEAAQVPFTHENGLLGEIGHILFTPSTTKDSLSHHSDNEFHAAERLGRDIGVDCETLFPECEGSVLDTFTQIGVDTLHKFGLF